jgi:hypothetical protein
VAEIARPALRQSTSIVSALEFDKEGTLFATAGVSKRIRRAAALLQLRPLTAAWRPVAGGIAARWHAALAEWSCLLFPAARW